MADAPPSVPGLVLQRQLGRGENAEVWLAHDQHGTQVAVKLIRPTAQKSVLSSSLQHEQQVLAQLDHPHIARVLDGGHDGTNMAYMVMEYVDGSDLNDWLALRRPLAQRLALLRQVALALNHAHRQGIIHRDLTPSNVLVDQHGMARVIDFGKARHE